MITVGIPAYNEGKSIAKTIESVRTQIGKNDEILVVDNGSKDNTSSEILRMREKDKRVRLLVIKNNNGKCPALNLMVEQAQGDIIVQTDADVVLENGAIAALLSHFKEKKIGAVSGNPVPIIPKSNAFYDWTLMSYRKAHELRVTQSREGALWHLSGYLCAFRKNAYTPLPVLKGAVDAWMGRMILNKGYSIDYEPAAKVLVKCPTNARDFVNQKARVRAGYYFLSKSLGKAPRKIQSEFLYLPQELMKVPLSRWHTFLFSGTVYLYAWLRGYYLAKTNKSLQQIWKTPVSTK